MVGANCAPCGLTLLLLAFYFLLRSQLYLEKGQKPHYMTTIASGTPVNAGKEFVRRLVCWVRMELHGDDFPSSTALMQNGSFFSTRKAEKG